MEFSKRKRSFSLTYAGVFISYLGLLSICLLVYRDAREVLDGAKKKREEGPVNSESIESLESSVSAAQSNHDTALFATLIVGFVFLLLIVCMLVTWCYSRDGASIEVRKNWFEVLLPVFVFFLAMFIFLWAGSWLSKDLVSRMTTTTAVNLLPIILVAGMWKAGSAAFLAHAHAKETEVETQVETQVKAEVENLGNKIDRLLQKAEALETQIGELQESSIRQSYWQRFSFFRKS